MADVTLFIDKLLITDWLTCWLGPATTKSTNPIFLTAPAPILEDLPPPTLYWMNRVLFPFTVLPTIYYLKHEGKSNLYISDFLIKTSISILILVGVLATMSYAVRYYSINTTILFSFIVYIILSLLFIRFIKINEPKG